MPKCDNCSKAQSKLNQGNLCKSCFNQSNDIYIVKDAYRDNDTPNISLNNTANDSLDSTTNPDVFPNITAQERGVVNIIKEHMLREQQQQKEYIELLHNQINYLKEDIAYLKNDIIHKNVIIESLVGDNNGWQLAKGSTANKTQINKNNFKLPLQNSFSVLPIEECINDINSKDTNKTINHHIEDYTNNRINNKAANNTNKSKIYINRNPEDNVLPLIAKCCCTNTCS